jgi:hypothetical protein
MLILSQKKAADRKWLRDRAPRRPRGVSDPLVAQIRCGTAADALNGRTRVPYRRPEPLSARMTSAAAKLAI